MELQQTNVVSDADSTVEKPAVKAKRFGAAKMGLVALALASVVGAVLFVSPFRATAQTGDVSVEAVSVGGALGRMATLPLTVDPLLSDLGGISIEVTYNDQEVSFENCAGDPELWACNSPEAGRVLVEAVTGTSWTEEFDLANISFTSTALVESSPVTIAVNGGVLDAQGSDLTQNLIDGAINFSNLGDVNCDGIRTSADALAVLQFDVQIRSDVGACPTGGALAKVNAGPGDMNNDTKVTSTDALYILQCIVGLTTPYCS